MHLLLMASSYYATSSNALVTSSDALVLCIPSQKEVRLAGDVTPRPSGGPEARGSTVSSDAFSR